MKAKSVEVKQITLPLQSAIAGGSAALGVLVATVVWIVSNFETRSAAKDRERQTNSRLEAVEKVVMNTSSDIAYIRGVLQAQVQPPKSRNPRRLTAARARRPKA